jgi:hypothetical protein
MVGGRMSFRILDVVTGKSRVAGVAAFFFALETWLY